MYWQLLLITIIPVIVTVVLYLIKIKTKFYNLPFWVRQIIIGIIFGALSVCATEFGVECRGATANVRDAAPLIAGLIFGGPAGIIAGTIGGVERFIAAWWGRGFITQWACSISTILAGVYAALLRKFMFEDKRPTFGLATAIAVVMEVFHFTLVFLTNMNNTVEIMVIIKALALPMIIANAVAVGLATGIVQFLTRKNEGRIEDKKRISNQIKWWLLGAIAFCYVISTGIVYGVETQTAYSEADEAFVLTISDVKKDVLNYSNNYMENILDSVFEEYEKTPYLPSMNLEEVNELRNHYHDLCESLNVYSIDIIQKDPQNKGIFVCSSDLGFQLDSFYMTMVEGQSSELHTMMTNGENTKFIQEFGKRSDEANNGPTFLKYAAQEINEDYYLIVSISEDQFRGMVNEKVETITTYRHVNNKGHILIMDYLNNQISDEINYKGKDSGLKIENLRNNKEYSRLRGNVYGEDCFYTYTEAETYTIVVMLPYDDVLSDRDSSFMLNSFMQVISYAVLYILIYMLIEKQVVKKVRIVNDKLSEIINGNLDVKVNVKSCIEFEKLSKDINHTVNTLKRYIDEAKKRIDDELEFAKTIQLSSLPSVFPAFPDKTEFDLYATMKTAKEVGGDFYDYYIIDNEHLVFLIADVSGKGIPAAMFMMESKVMLKNLAKTLLSPEEVVMRANDGLAQNNEANMFVTCWFGVLNFKTGHVKYVNAGHNSPLIYRKDGDYYDYIGQKKNLVLAAMEGAKYNLQELDLKPGDRIYLYTDGVTEATRGDNTLYGEERLLKRLNKIKNSTLEKTLKNVKTDIDRFVDGADQFDDITMLILEYRGIQK